MTGMPGGGRIDRKKHEVDITERVLEGGVWTGPPHSGAEHVISLELDRHSWPFGTVSSSVQIEVGDEKEDDER